MGSLVRLLALFLLVTGPGAPSEAAAGGCGGKVARWGKAVRKGALIGLVTLGGAAGGYVAVEHHHREADQVLHGDEDEAFRIVVYGDSLSSGCSGYRSLFRTVWDMRTRLGGWPADVRPGNVESLFERLCDAYPQADFCVWNCARPGAYVDPARNQSGLVKRLLAGTDDFAAQVDKVVAAPEFPALHLAFIGHNNLDWYYDVHKYGLDRDDYVRSLPAGVGAAYEAQLRRLVDRAREASRAGRETEIVVYGLLNADDGLDLVRRAVEEHRRDPERFPHIETLDSRMPSFLPAHAAATKALAKAVNDELERRVTRLRRELGNDANVRIRFSRILTEAPWRDLGLLSPYDGLHLSPQGMTYVSELVAEDLEAHGSLLPISATD